MSEIKSIIITSNQMCICHINNNQNPIVHSLTRSRVQGVSSMPLHPRGPKSCTLRRTQSIAPVYVNTQNNISIMPHNHNQTTNSIIIQITCKQVSSKNKFAQCAQERDVTDFCLKIDIPHAWDSLNILMYILKSVSYT
jgi:hypothetical protein